jgi:acetylornithine deacetylase
MNIFELTRALIDIQSVTNAEKRVGEYLFEHLSNLAQLHDGRVERMEVEAERFNVFAYWGDPLVTMSTHMDTVPPFLASREDAETIWGRGSCDAKGIIACMIAAAEKLLSSGARNFGLLFVVGEEHNGAGARMAAKSPRGSRYLINGEPTENHVALGAKGALRFEIVARGRLAHSAYPELGESAIESLLDTLQAVRAISLPKDELFGQSTLNVGTIAGGRAANVIADYAQAEIMFRLVGSAEPIRAVVAEAAAGRAEVREVHYTPAQRLQSFPGLPTTVVSFTTDISCFGDSWGKPFLIGPGSINVAHTAEECVSKQQLMEAVEIYSRMTTKLLSES